VIVISVTIFADTFSSLKRTRIWHLLQNMVLITKTLMYYQGKKVDTGVAIYSYLEAIAHLLVLLHLLEM